MHFHARRSQKGAIPFIAVIVIAIMAVVLPTTVKVLQNPQQIADIRNRAMEVLEFGGGGGLSLDDLLRDNVQEDDRRAAIEDKQRAFPTEPPAPKSPRSEDGEDSRPPPPKPPEPEATRECVASDCGCESGYSCRGQYPGCACFKEELVRPDGSVVITTPQPKGEGCTSDTQCETGYCDRSRNVCLYKSSDSNYKECENTRQCPDDKWCNNGRCTTERPQPKEIPFYGGFSTCDTYKDCPVGYGCFSNSCTKVQRGVCYENRECQEGEYCHRPGGTTGLCKSVDSNPDGCQSGWDCGTAPNGASCGTCNQGDYCSAFEHKCRVLLSAPSGNCERQGYSCTSSKICQIEGGKSQPYSCSTGVCCDFSGGASAPAPTKPPAPSSPQTLAQRKADCDKKLGEFNPATGRCDTSAATAQNPCAKCNAKTEICVMQTFGSVECVPKTIASAPKTPPGAVSPPSPSPTPAPTPPQAGGPAVDVSEIDERWIAGNAARQACLAQGQRGQACENAFQENYARVEGDIARRASRGDRLAQDKGIFWQALAEAGKEAGNNPAYKEFLDKIKKELEVTKGDAKASAAIIDGYQQRILTIGYAPKATDCLFVDRPCVAADVARRSCSDYAGKASLQLDCESKAIAAYLSTEVNLSAEEKEFQNKIKILGDAGIRDLLTKYPTQAQQQLVVAALASCTSVFECSVKGVEDQLTKLTQANPNLVTALTPGVAPATEKSLNDLASAQCIHEADDSPTCVDTRKKELAGLLPLLASRMAEDSCGEEHRDSPGDQARYEACVKQRSSIFTSPVGLDSVVQSAIAALGNCGGSFGKELAWCMSRERVPLFGKVSDEELADSAVRTLAQKLCAGEDGRYLGRCYQRESTTIKKNLPSVAAGFAQALCEAKTGTERIGCIEERKKELTTPLGLWRLAQTANLAYASNCRGFFGDELAACMAASGSPVLGAFPTTVTNLDTSCKLTNDPKTSCDVAKYAFNWCSDHRGEGFEYSVGESKVVAYCERQTRTVRDPRITDPAYTGQTKVFTRVLDCDPNDPRHKDLPGFCEKAEAEAKKWLPFLPRVGKDALVGWVVSPEVTPLLVFSQPKRPAEFANWKPQEPTFCEYCPPEYQAAPDPVAAYCSDHPFEQIILGSGKTERYIRCDRDGKVVDLPNHTGFFATGVDERVACDDEVKLHNGCPEHLLFASKNKNDYRLTTTAIFARDTATIDSVGDRLLGFFAENGYDVGDRLPDCRSTSPIANTDRCRQFRQVVSEWTRSIGVAPDTFLNCEFDVGNPNDYGRAGYWNRQQCAELGNFVSFQSNIGRRIVRGFYRPSDLFTPVGGVRLQSTDLVKSVGDFVGAFGVGTGTYVGLAGLASTGPALAGTGGLYAGLATGDRIHLNNIKSDTLRFLGIPQGCDVHGSTVNELRFQCSSPDAEAALAKKIAGDVSRKVPDPFAPPRFSVDPALLGGKTAEQVLSAMAKASGTITKEDAELVKHFPALAQAYAQYWTIYQLGGQPILDLNQQLDASNFNLALSWGFAAFPFGVKYVPLVAQPVIAGAGQVGSKFLSVLPKPVQSALTRTGNFIGTNVNALGRTVGDSVGGTLDAAGNAIGGTRAGKFVGGLVDRYSGLVESGGLLGVPERFRNFPGIASQPSGEPITDPRRLLGPGSGGGEGGGPKSPPVIELPPPKGAARPIPKVAWEGAPEAPLASGTKIGGVAVDDAVALSFVDANGTIVKLPLTTTEPPAIVQAADGTIGVRSGSTVYQVKPGTNVTFTTRANVAQDVGFADLQAGFKPVEPLSLSIESGKGRVQDNAVSGHGGVVQDVTSVKGGASAVADGVTGEGPNSAIAAKIAAGELTSFLEPKLISSATPEEIAAQLESFIDLNLHNRIIAEAKGGTTTLIGGGVKDGKLILARVGDSEAYIVRNGKIIQLDPPIEARSLAQETRQTQGGYGDAPNQLGSPGDTFKGAKVTIHNVQSGDRILFTSDGLQRSVTLSSDQVDSLQGLIKLTLRDRIIRAGTTIEEAVAKAATPHLAEEALLGAAIKSGLKDDVGVVVSFVKETPPVGNIGQSVTQLNAGPNLGQAFGWVADRVRGVSPTLATKLEGLEGRVVGSGLTYKVQRVNDLVRSHVDQLLETNEIPQITREVSQSVRRQLASAGITDRAALRVRARELVDERLQTLLPDRGSADAGLTLRIRTQIRQRFSGDTSLAGAENQGVAGSLENLRSIRDSLSTRIAQNVAKDLEQPIVIREGVRLQKIGPDGNAVDEVTLKAGDRVRLNTQFAGVEYEVGRDQIPNVGLGDQVVIRQAGRQTAFLSFRQELQAAKGPTIFDRARQVVDDGFANLRSRLPRQQAQPAQAPTATVPKNAPLEVSSFGVIEPVTSRVSQQEALAGLKRYLVDYPLPSGGKPPFQFADLDMKIALKNNTLDVQPFARTLSGDYYRFTVRSGDHFMSQKVYLHFSDQGSFDEFVGYLRRGVAPVFKNNKLGLEFKVYQETDFDIYLVFDPTQAGPSELKRGIDAVRSAIEKVNRTGGRAYLRGIAEDPAGFYVRKDGTVGDLGFDAVVGNVGSNDNLQKTLFIALKGKSGQAGSPISYAPTGRQELDQLLSVLESNPTAREAILDEFISKTSVAFRNPSDVSKIRAIPIAVDLNDARSLTIARDFTQKLEAKGHKVAFISKQDVFEYTNEKGLLKAGVDSKVWSDGKYTLPTGDQKTIIEALGVKESSVHPAATPAVGGQTPTRLVSLNDLQAGESLSLRPGVGVSGIDVDSRAVNLVIQDGARIGYFSESAGGKYISGTVQTGKPFEIPKTVRTIQIVNPGEERVVFTASKAGLFFDIPTPGLRQRLAQAWKTPTRAVEVDRIAANNPVTVGEGTRLKTFDANGNEITLTVKNGAKVTIEDAGGLRRSFAVGKDPTPTISGKEASVTIENPNALAQTFTVSGGRLIVENPVSGAPNRLVRVSRALRENPAEGLPEGGAVEGERNALQRLWDRIRGRGAGEEQPPPPAGVGAPPPGAPQAAPSARGGFERGLLVVALYQTIRGAAQEYFDSWRAFYDYGTRTLSQVLTGTVREIPGYRGSFIPTPVPGRLVSPPTPARPPDPDQVGKVPDGVSYSCTKAGCTVTNKSTTEIKVCGFAGACEKRDDGYCGPSWQQIRDANKDWGVTCKTLGKGGTYQTTGSTQVSCGSWQTDISIEGYVERFADGTVGGTAAANGKDFSGCQPGERPRDLTPVTAKERTTQEYNGKTLVTGSGAAITVPTSGTPVTVTASDPSAKVIVSFPDGTKVSVPVTSANIDTTPIAHVAAPPKLGAETNTIAVGSTVTNGTTGVRTTISDGSKVTVLNKDGKVKSTQQIRAGTTVSLNRQTDGGLIVEQSNGERFDFRFPNLKVHAAEEELVPATEPVQESKSLLVTLLDIIAAPFVFIWNILVGIWNFLVSLVTTFFGSVSVDFPYRSVTLVP